MSNRFALIFGLLILVAIVGDHLFNDGATSLFLMRKFAVFIEYLAFWR
ncbi:MAG: hypothetical protein ACK5M4_08770 [Pseudorhodobacter sp.]